MTSRYDNRTISINNNRMYKEQFLNRKISRIRQFRSSAIRYPTPEEMGEFAIITHVWSTGDRFFKLSNHYYGDPRVWWVIPWFNQKILESDFVLGDTVLVPQPLEEALTYFNL